MSEPSASDATRHVARCVPGVRCLFREYRPRRPQEGVVYQVVREHYETFRTEAAARRDGDALPRFVDEEFRGFLRLSTSLKAA